MLKWIILAIVLLVVTIFVIRIIKVMLKTEKDSKKSADKVSETKEVEYQPENPIVDLHSSNNTIMTDMSVKKDEKVSDFNFDMPSGFTDDVDEDFNDFSAYARGGKGRRRQPVDFDLDGDFADEYIPSSPDFNYLPKRQPKQKKPIATELNELPTELKVLMLSDIFDRKFFD